MNLFTSAAARHGAALILVLAAGCAPVGPAPVQVQVADLAGRSAGPPQRCTTIVRGEGLRPVDADTVVYGRGKTLFVSELGPRCAGFPLGHVLVVEPIGSQYCRGDRVRSFDATSRVPGPACILGDFVPYRR